MAGRTLTSSLVVRLIDQVSGPARKAASSLLGISRASNQDFGVRLRDAFEKNQRSLERARTGMLEAMATVYALKEALSAPLERAVDFETLMEDIGQKADLSGDKLSALGKRIRAVARETNQTAKTLGESVDFLIGMGASADNSIAMARPIGRAATAYRAASIDLAKSAFAVQDNLKVPVDDVAKALDIMAQAGKEGGFELKDMATEFPNITAAAQALGIKGTKGVADLVAALEVARKGAATGAEAANNMANFIQKIVSKETLKNFKKFGVDVPKELKKAMEKGESPIEHMLVLIDKLTNGGQADKVAQLFGDKQVLDFIRPMLANMKEYRRIRDAALAAQGVVEKDYASRLETTLGKLQRFQASWDNLMLTLGDALLPGFTRVLDVVGNIANKFAVWADANPKLAATIIEITTALVGLRLAIATLSWLTFSGKAGILGGLMGVNAVKDAATAGSMWGKAFGLAARLAVVAALAGITAEILQAIDPKGNLGGLTKPIDDAVRRALGLKAKDTGITPGEIWDGLGNLFSSSSEADKPSQQTLDKRDVRQKRGDVLGAVENWPKAAVDGMKSYVDAIVSGGADGQRKADEAAALIKQALTIDGKLSIDTSALDSAIAKAQALGAAIRSATANASAATPVKTPTKIDAGSWNPRTPSGARARGGNVWPGGSFLVGENEPEIFSPKKSGTITPVGKVGGNTVHLEQHFHGITGNADEIARAAARKTEDALDRLLRGANADTGVHG